MNCPNCKKSLWIVKDVCPFCRTIIAPSTKTATVSATDPGCQDDLVSLVQCGTLPEADAIRTHLATAGITAFLPDENSMQTLALKLGSFVQVHVYSRDYHAAKQALTSMKQAAGAAAAEPSVPPAAIPLSFPEKCFAFMMGSSVCPGLLVFLLMKRGFSSQGHDRKATEVSYWFLGGFICAIIVGVLLFVVSDPRQ